MLVSNGTINWIEVCDQIRSEQRLCDITLQKILLVGMWSNGEYNPNNTKASNPIPFSILKAIINTQTKQIKGAKSNILSCALMNNSLSATVMEQLLSENDGQWMSHEADDKLLCSTFLVENVSWPFDKLQVLLHHFGEGAHFIFRMALLMRQKVDVLCIIAEKVSVDKYFSLYEGSKRHQSILNSDTSNLLHLALKVKLGWDEGLALILCRNTALAAVKTEGHLPLHQALESGTLEWNKGLKQLLASHPSAVVVKDDITGLYPFMIASTNPFTTLDVIYELLKQSPYLSNVTISLE